MTQVGNASRWLCVNSFSFLLHFAEGERVVHSGGKRLETLTVQVKATDTYAASVAFVMLCCSSPGNKVNTVTTASFVEMYPHVGLSCVSVAWSPVISLVWYPDPERPRNKAAWLWGPTQSHDSQLGGEAGAQVTCFCVAG